jgi:putative PEP-CTERM system histidine kinase
MEIFELATIGNALAAAVFGCFVVVLLTRWKDRPLAGRIAAAAGATALWAIVQAAGSQGKLSAPILLLVVELFRNLTWLAVAIAMLGNLDVNRISERIAYRYGALFVGAGILLTGKFAWSTDAAASLVLIVGAGLILSALILILTEQIFRNAPFDARSGLRYFCVGLAGIFVYDLIVYSLIIVSDYLNPSQWAARGFVNALFAVPLTFAVHRSFRLSPDKNVPYQFTFYFFSIIAVTAFIVVAFLADYYIDVTGGTLSGVFGILLFASVALFTAVLIVSPTVRARVRVVVMKIFFQYKYDYRKEWLRFISTLSTTDADNVPVTAIRSVAQIVNSPGGVVWVQEDEGKSFEPFGAWNCALPVTADVAADSALAQFLRQREWVIDLVEMRDYPMRYGGLILNDWVGEYAEWWLVVPLFLQKKLFGFIVLEKPRIVPSLNFEDHDLLRTVGRHVATYIHQTESDRRLTESRQFGTYNRLTAFLMHDLNNLIAQQTLVVKNAEKFRHNPDFVDDAIGTIANSVARMQRLMEQLSSGSEKSAIQELDIRALLKKAAKRCEPRLPKPRVESGKSSVFVNADPERLTTVFEHLIRNAQDATKETGFIDVSLTADDNSATITIADNGCGMTPEFIRERLFRPFDSTKGSQSMGIGAYQARDYVRQLGGHIDVASTVGEGTRFEIRLPIA